MQVRRYMSTDCEQLEKLFYDTVHTVNAKDYTQEQLDAWATGSIDSQEWNRSFLSHFTVVAVENGIAVGFGDIDSFGFLHRLYVHKDYQRKGIATAVCDMLEINVDAEKIVTHSSVTAKPFFESRGYKAVKKQQVERRGIMLTNFVMEKSLHFDSPKT